LRPEKSGPECHFAAQTAADSRDNGHLHSKALALRLTADVLNVASGAGIDPSPFTTASAPHWHDWRPRLIVITFFIATITFGHA
jgi:hypothetical protein